MMRSFWRISEQPDKVINKEQSQLSLDRHSYDAQLGAQLRDWKGLQEIMQ